MEPKINLWLYPAWLLMNPAEATAALNTMRARARLAPLLLPDQHAQFITKNGAAMRQKGEK